MARGKQTLTQRIALDGGEEIRKELEALGTVGEQAFKKLSAAAGRADVASSLQKSIAKLRAEFDKLRTAGSNFGTRFRELSGAFTTFDRAVASSIKRIGVFTAAVSGAVFGVERLLTSFGKTAEDISEEAQTLGLTNTQYQILQRATQQAGVSQESFNKVLLKFGLASDEAQKAAKSVATEYSVIGKNGEAATVKITRGAQEIVTSTEDLHGNVRTLNTGLNNTKDLFSNIVKFSNQLKGKSGLQQVTEIMKHGIGKREAIEAARAFRAFSTQLDQFGGTAKDLLPVLDDFEIGIGIELDDAFDRLGINLVTAKNRIAALFGPGATAVITTFNEAIRSAFDKLNEVIIENFGSIENFRDQVKTTFAQIAKDIVNTLSFNDDAVQNKGLIRFRDAVIAIGQVFERVFLVIIPKAIETIGPVLTKIADQINKIFGTNLQGTDIAVILIVAQFSGALTILSAALGIATAAFGLFTSGIGLLATAFEVIAPALATFSTLLVDGLIALAALVGLPAEVAVAVIAGLAVLAIAIFVFWDDIVAASKRAWTAVKDEATRAFNDIEQNGLKNSALHQIAPDLADTFEVAFKAIRDGFLGLVEFIIDQGSKLVSALNSLFSKIKPPSTSITSGSSGRRGSEGTSAFSPTPIGPLGTERFAGGGLFRGRGTGTSDSNLVWLGNREYVVNAKATKFYGVGLLNAINSMKLDFKGLSVGGLVEGFSRSLTGAFEIPALATGGLVPARAAPSGAPVNLHIGGEVFKLIAGEATIEQLRKHALTKQTTSNGARPKWSGAR